MSEELLDEVSLARNRKGFEDVSEAINKLMPVHLFLIEKAIGGTETGRELAELEKKRNYFLTNILDYENRQC